MRFISRNSLLFLFFIFLIPFNSFSQVEAWPGTWRMQSVVGNSSPITIELQIAASERNILFPAQLKLQCDGFSGTYQLLLVKKTVREIAISKNKYAVAENPFSINNALSFLNGILDYSNGVKGVATLTVNRMQSKQLSNLLADTMHLNKTDKTIAARLIQFLKETTIQFEKVNNTPWENPAIETILSPHLSLVYFGVTDTIHVQEKNGTYTLTGYKNYKKEDFDIVTASLNGATIINQVAINKKPQSDDIYLDTGLNILVFFADNFGNNIPGKAKMTMNFANKNPVIDFDTKGDSAATFIVAQLYYDHDKTKDKDFENYSGSQTPLKKDDKLIGSLVSTSQQLTFAIWDDALEDGDSISININGKTFVHGFPVKIKPQFLTVTLKPGPNTITYIADNVGSIPPNTSILEIIDGNKRRSFSIETTMGENNLINIFYDVKAP